ncbi:MAG: DUF4115 domain-containing protein [Alphaproteobacteria bacterium]|nr:DUF4115 domain-containing protein [Alphaproteobacteria bacterium]
MIRKKQDLFDPLESEIVEEVKQDLSSKKEEKSKKKSSQKEKVYSKTEKSEMKEEATKIDRLTEGEEVEKEEIIEEKPIGIILKEARLKKGISLEEISDSLCIRLRYLEALEDENYKIFPAVTYVYGFLRTYASFLRLDSDELVLRLCQKTATLKKKENDMFPPVIRKQFVFPTKSVLLMAFFLLFFVYIFWHFVLTPKPLDLTPEKVPAEIMKDKEEVKPAPLVPDISKEEVLQKGEKVQKKSVASLRKDLEEKPSSRTYGTTKESAAIWLIATEDSWVEITQEDTIVLSLVLKKGDSYYVPKEGEYFLKTGNAGGLDIFIDGKKYPPLGKRGAVYSGVFLSPESLKDRLKVE